MSLFSNLRPHTRIIVTGCQRSGTRIATKMIAHDLGLWYRGEEDIAVYDFERLRDLCLNSDRFVVQAPAVSHRIHELPGDPAICFMLRDPAEVADSARRIGWTRFERRELANYGATEGHIYAVKLDHWRQVQKPLITHAFEIDYASLAEHPLWVPREQREGWGWGRTTA